MKHRYKLFRYVLVIFIIFIAPLVTHAQTTGLIYSPATSAGSKVLDPNADGYVSMTRSGFSGTNDEGVGISEIPYRPFPALTTEPIADLNTGSSGGHTDLATPTPGNAFTGSPVAAYFDGTHILFRIRLGSSSTASKGYSVLIDSDNTFNGTGTNPGFEYEVLLASNFAVQVIRHTSSGPSTIFTGSIDQYSQRAVAASTSGGNADYFYDFYVPLTAFKGGIDASTQLRMSGITITSAQSGITGTVSDVGGVNFQAYNYDAPSAWRALINAFPPTSLSTLQTSAFPQIAATAPVVAGPVLANSTSISGTSTEAVGSTITVYRSAGGGTPAAIGTTTVAANGTWVLSGIPSTLLTAGNVITATVKPTGKTVSPSSNTVTVSSGICTATPAPVITALGGSGSNRTFTGTTAYTSSQRITIYIAGTSTVVGSFLFTPPAGTTGSSTWTSPIYALTENNYYATVTPVNSNNTTILGCESLRSNQLCYRNGNNPGINAEKVSITSVTYNNTVFSSSNSSVWSEVPTNVATITGAVEPTSSIVSTTIVLFINGLEQSLRTTVTTSTSAATSWSLSVPANILQVGNIIAVRTVRTLTGGGQFSCPNSFSSPSNLLTVQETTTAPTINPPKCGLVTTLTGTSTEAPGAVIQLYTGGTEGQRNGTLIVQNGTTTPITATVTSTGAWAVDFSAAAGGGIPAGTAITARAKATGKVRSVNSAAVSSSAGPTGVLTVNPVTEGATSVIGTGPTSAAGAKVTLYIEGTPFPTPVLVSSDGSWSVTGIASQELFAGAKVSATFTPTDGCESARANTVTVTCKAPVATFALSPSPATICGGGSTSVTLSGSEFGISYRLLVNGVESGSSVLGTGGPITLTSGPITNYTTANATVTLTYRARKISGTTCDANSTASEALTVRPQPVTSGLTFTSSSQGICANATASFSLSGTSTSYNYQLVNQATNQLVGSPVRGVSTGAITLSTGAVISNTTFSLRISPVTGDANSCVTMLQDQVTVTITSPSVTRAVFPESSKVCVGGATAINVSTEPNSDLEYRVYRRAGTTPNPSSDPLLGTFLGNGGIRSLATGPLGTAGTQTFYVTVTRLTGNTCGTLTLVNMAQVEVTNNPATANAGNDIAACGTSVVLQANAVVSGIGKWSQVNGPSTVTFSSESNPNATAQNLMPGAYTFRWTVEVACGTGTSTASDDVAVTVNCDASYTIAVPKYVDEYSRGDVLATATDPDAPLKSATIIAGVLPSGMALNSITGAFTVAVPSELAEGTYRLTVRLVDEFDGVTLSTITLRIYGESPAIVPLPVELVYFTATLRQGVVNLLWMTASEDNNSHFEVERSADGKTFEGLGRVVGNGTSSRSIKYTYIDNNPPTGTAYYRLKQVDFDGESAYSKVVAVSAKGIAADLQLPVYPNPFRSALSITVTAEHNGHANLQLVDMQGRVVYTGKVELKPGLNELTVPLQFLRNGLYILKLYGNGINGAVKVVKE